MSIIWRKVWRDLVNSKLRTLLVVVSIAVGVFALGLVFGLSGLMRERMTQDHRASLPAHIAFWGGPFEQEIVDSLLEEPEVAAAQGEVFTTFRWRLVSETDWRNGYLLGRSDYSAQRMNLINLVEGKWPDRRTLAIERQSARYLNIPLGAGVLVELGGHQREMPVEGILRDPTAFPPQFGGDASFYTSPETITWLSDSAGFNQISIRLKAFEQMEAEQVAKRFERRLQRAGLSLEGFLIINPNVHWLQEQIDTLFLILAVLGALALALSGFLIINTMTSILAQQVWQIGVMKVVGATFGHVTKIYLAISLIYGALATFIALPLGAIGAYLASGWLLSLINIYPGEFQVTPLALVAPLLVGLAVPIPSALVPVMGAARITPHQAMSNYGLGASFGRDWLDRLLGRIRYLPRPLALSLRNTFRRKTRVALTLITLVLGGVMFVTVTSVGNSLNNTLDVLLGDFGFDVLIGFERPYRVSRLVEVAKSIPQVQQAEVWDRHRATFVLPSGEEQETFLWSLPPDSAIFHPRIVSGRGLRANDGRAILLNSKIAADEGIQVGDELQLTIDGRDATWTVVGLVLNVNNDQRDSFVPFDSLARETANLHRGTIVAAIISDQHDAISQERMAITMRDVYTARRLKPSNFQSASDVREQSRTQFDLITSLMVFMALLAALVGSIGLMGTMSINVVERSREIGIMRAIGGTSAAILLVFVGEGIVVGGLSWLLVVPLSYPGARIFSDVVGRALLGVPLDFSYSLRGLGLWLMVVLIMSALASLWPALRAASLHVREALAYE